MRVAGLVLVAAMITAAGCADRTGVQETQLGAISDQLPAKTRETEVDASVVVQNSTTTTVTIDEHTVAFLGDVSCSASRRSRETCPDEAVRDAILRDTPERIIMIGDVQYPSHGERDYRESFLPVWGGLIERIRTVPGNHEYEMSGAKGYYEAWGPGPGWWSERVGQWLLVGINTSDGCREVRCDTGSEQYNWLLREIQDEDCVVVFGHHPRLSSGAHGNTERLSDVWEALEYNNVEAYISGHDHHYERIPGEGVTQYVVGTGGAEIRPVTGRKQGVVENRHGYLSFKISGDRALVSFISGQETYDTHDLVCR